MERKNLSQIPLADRESFNRASKASVADLQNGINLLKELVKNHPDYGPVRDRLRELEKRKLFMQGGMAKMLASATALFKVPVINAKMNADPEKAMGMCEDILAGCLDNVPVLCALADAAEMAEAPFIEVEALKIALELHPGNESVSMKLARALQHDGKAREAVKFFKEYAAKRPNDIGAQSELRAAMALASIEKGKWEAEGSSQQKSVDAKGAVAQQLIEGTIHDANQAKMLIEKFQKDLAEKESTDTRKKLAEAYMVAQDYGAAIEQYQKVAELIGSLDPFIDKAMEKAYSLQVDQAVGELKKNPGAYENPEQQIRDLEAQKTAFQMERRLARVKAYPNDALLHCDLADLYFESGDYENALPEFQQAVKSPQKRLHCLVAMGRCFAWKKQYDIAAEQIETALKEMPAMDKGKLAALYYLGKIYEESGNMEQAIVRYKEIYQHQAKYEDVEERIEKYYSQKQKNQ